MLSPRGCGLKLAVFCTGPAIRNAAANVITEVVGTAVLVFGVLMLVRDADGEASHPGSSAVGPEELARATDDAWLIGVGDD